MLLVSFFNFAQDTTSFVTTEQFQNEIITYKSDTFLIVHYVEKYNAEQMISEYSDAYLYSVKDGLVEELIAKQNTFEEQYEGEPFENTLYHYAQSVIDDMINANLEENEYLYSEDMYFEYYNIYKIEQVKSNVLEVSFSFWSYEGGAHGSGNTDYEYFDLESKSYFDLNSCYDKEVYNFIYEEIKKDFFSDGEPDDDFYKQLDEETEGKRELTPGQYYFTDEALIVQIQMYDVLYDSEAFYIGYNSWEVSITYEKLNSFLIPESPIERMLRN